MTTKAQSTCEMLRDGSNVTIRGVRLTDSGAEHEAALIALTDETDGQREVGVAYFSTLANGKTKVAVTVRDGWQHKGLETALLKRLIEVARTRCIDGLYFVDSAASNVMRELAEHLGFERRPDPEDVTQVLYSLSLRRPVE